MPILVVVLLSACMQPSTTTDDEDTAGGDPVGEIPPRHQELMDHFAGLPDPEAWQVGPLDQLYRRATHAELQRHDWDPGTFLMEGGELWNATLGHPAVRVLVPLADDEASTVDFVIAAEPQEGSYAYTSAEAGVRATLTAADRGFYADIHLSDLRAIIDANQPWWQLDDIPAPDGRKVSVDELARAMLSRTGTGLEAEPQVQVAEHTWSVRIEPETSGAYSIEIPFLQIVQADDIRELALERLRERINVTNGTGSFEFAENGTRIRIAADGGITLEANRSFSGDVREREAFLSWDMQGNEVKRKAPGGPGIGLTWEVDFAAGTGHSCWAWGSFAAILAPGEHRTVLLDEDRGEAQGWQAQCA
jgi:hypothetical protein